MVADECFTVHLRPFSFSSPLICFKKKKFENICHCQRFYNILNNRELKEWKADRYSEKCQNIESSQC